MNIKMEETSNKELTCSYNNVRLHSFYNPIKEAERFVNSIENIFDPSFILITEPALSYCLQFLKERFPNSKICCIRFCLDFYEFNKNWDKVFYTELPPTKDRNINLSEEIFNYMGEDGIAACLFLSWKASDRAFIEESNFAWNEIKKSVLKSRSVLGTRNYFAKRWTKNALRFSLFSNKTATIQKGTEDILICASGPSLKSSIKLIKKYRKRFFLIAVSSALTPLVDNEIIPDLCISTDGGYYAKQHISFSLIHHKIPLAIPGEGCCFASVMNNNTIIPLFYGDGISEDILRAVNFTGINAKRNGSVSGTALELALNLTDGKIFYCGLDLAFSKTYAHTQPNELEKNDSRFDGRLAPLETRITASNINTSSIEIYRSWFNSNDFAKRVFRLSDNYNYLNKLLKIPEINWKTFTEKTKDFEKKSKIKFINLNNDLPKEMMIKKIKTIIKEKSLNKKWIHDALPSESIVMERSLTKSSYENAKKIVEKGMENFIQDIIRAIEK